MITSQTTALRIPERQPPLRPEDARRRGEVEVRPTFGEVEYGSSKLCPQLGQTLCSRSTSCPQFGQL
jgi:hypothetical protein